MGRSASGTDAFAAGGLDEQPEHNATVSSFRLDLYEVTSGRLRRWVKQYAGAPAAGAGAHPRIANSGWQSSWNSKVPATAEELDRVLHCSYSSYTSDPMWIERQPANCFDWYLAFAFCAWDGGRLC